MEIVAFDTDDKADNSGKAKITWISKTLLNTKHKMGGSPWGSSGMRTYLADTIKPLIPSDVRTAIVGVSKTSKGVSSSDTTSDELWIPSYREMMNNNTHEPTGVVYSTAYSVSSKRIKKHKGYADEYVTRSMFGTASYERITASGNVSQSAYGEGNYGIALGFCTD